MKTGDSNLTPAKALASLGLLLVISGCSSRSDEHLVNASFPVGRSEARRQLQELERDKTSLQRPVLVLGGFRDPSVGAQSISRSLSRVIDAGQSDWIVSVSFSGFEPHFDACAAVVIEALEERFPTPPGSRESVEVDVVALSMGGLVARHAALDAFDARGKRLRIARLFTISTPHRGARMARLPGGDVMQTDMRPGSKFLRRLDGSPPDYPVFPYARLGDSIVGSENTAPVGEQPWWCSPGRFDPAHQMVFADERILLDIALKLRGGPGVATEPRQPLPNHREVR